MGKDHLGFSLFSIPLMGRLSKIILTILSGFLIVPFMSGPSLSSATDDNLRCQLKGARYAPPGGTPRIVVERGNVRADLTLAPGGFVTFGNLGTPARSFACDVSGGRWQCARPNETILYLRERGILTLVATEGDGVVVTTAWECESR